MDLTQEQRNYLEEQYHINIEEYDIDSLCEFLMKEIEKKKDIIEHNDRKMAMMKEANEEIEKLFIDQEEE